MTRSLALAALLAAAPAWAQQAAGAPAAPVAAPAQPAPRVLGLLEAIRTALDHQPQLLQARAASEAASARSDEARSSLLPQVSGSAAYQRSTYNFAPRPGQNPAGSTALAGNSTWATTGYWSFGATLSQLIWDFQSFDRYRAAQASAEAQRGTERYTSFQVILGVESAFFAARAGKALMGVARENLANQDAHLRQIEGFVKAGTRPEIDLAQARTDRANARVQLINAENAYLTEKAQLNQAMGVEAPTDYEVADDVLAPVTGEDAALDPLLEEAVKQRPDIAALEQQVRAQELTVSAAKGGYFPALGVSTGISDNGPSFDNLVWNWNATATLTWNLFQGGYTSALSSEARANLDNVKAQVAGLRQQVRVDVDQARLAVRASKQALDAAGEALVNARERLRLAEGRYQAGVGSAIELGDAQVALTTAAAQRVQAEYNLSTSRAQLLRALGRELPRA
jgi:outer membrane protein